MMGSAGGDDGVKDLISGLLAVVTDSGPSQQRLAQLLKETQAANEAVAQAKTLSQQNEHTLADLKKMNEELTNKITAHNEAVQEADKKFKTKEDELTAREKELDVYAAHQNTRASQAASAEVALKKLRSDHDQKVAADLRVSSAAIANERVAAAAEIKAKKDDLEKFAATLNAKELALDKLRIATERDKSFWEEKTAALKRAIEN